MRFFNAGVRIVFIGETPIHLLIKTIVFKKGTPWAT